MVQTNKINFRNTLSGRIHMEDIYTILTWIENNNERKQELYELIFDTDEKTAYQTAWVFTNMNLQENRWLHSKQNELIDELLICKHPGKRRLLLALLYRQPTTNPPHPDLLDFCLEHMVCKDELPGVKTLCMKLAYELCRPIPELIQELRVIFEIMEPHLLPPSIRTVRRNILQAMQSGKSLQRY